MADKPQLASLLAESESDSVSNLNTQLPVAPPVSLNEFAELSDLIQGVHPDSHTDPRSRSIAIPRSKLAVTPAQLFAAWQLLNQRENTGLRGGLLASAAGTGKAYIILAVALLRARIYQSASQVKTLWTSSNPKGRKTRSSPGAHLPADAYGSGLVCPSQKDGDILCYCVPTSKARRFVDANVAPRGVSLIQAPLPILGQWIEIFEGAVLDTSAYNLCIVHENVPSRLKRDFRGVVKSLSQTSGRVSVAPETYIFLSSHGNTKVLGTFAGEYSPSVGLMFSDESHVAMRLESRSMAIAQSQSQVGQGLDLWLVSATPIRSLEDWELPISLFSNSSELSRTAAVADIIGTRARARSSKHDMAAFQSHFNKVFDLNLVLRNTVTSKFCGKPITDLQIIQPNKVWLTTPQQYFDDIQEVAYQAREVFRSEARIAKDNKVAYQPQYASNVDAGLQFVSVFPGAAKLIRQGDLDIEERAVRESIDKMKGNKLKVEMVARFTDNLEEIFHGSPKLDFILAEIQRMREDKDERAPDPELQGSLHAENLKIKKMVIVTPNLGTAVFLYLFLLKRVPSLAPALLHTRARPEHREAVLNSFTSLTARKNARHSYILVTPFSAGGTGLNLQSANYQILVSPLNSRDSETQCFARTNRTGQRLSLHHSVLVTQDNPADQINVVKYADRTIRNDPFEMSRRLVLAEPDGSKAIQRLEDWGYKVENVDIGGLGELMRTHLEDFPLVNTSEIQVRRVTVPSVTKATIDELVYFDSSDFTFSDTLVCTQAWNKRNDERHIHEKLPLREIFCSFWVLHLGRQLRNLKRILYYDVIQEDLADELRPLVYGLMGEDMRTSLVIRREGGSAQEAEAFAVLCERAPFCNGAQKMVRELPEFEEVEIESFEFLPMRGDEELVEGQPLFSFRIHLR